MRCCIKYQHAVCLLKKATSCVGINSQYICFVPKISFPIEKSIHSDLYFYFNHHQNITCSRQFLRYSKILTQTKLLIYKIKMHIGRRSNSQLPTPKIFVYAIITKDSLLFYNLNKALPKNRRSSMRKTRKQRSRRRGKYPPNRWRTESAKSPRRCPTTARSCETPNSTRRADSCFPSIFPRAAGRGAPRAILHPGSSRMRVCDGAMCETREIPRRLDKSPEIAHCARVSRERFFSSSSSSSLDGASDFDSRATAAFGASLGTRLRKLFLSLGRGIIYAFDGDEEDWLAVSGLRIWLNWLSWLFGFTVYCSRIFTDHEYSITNWIILCSG